RIAAAGPGAVSGLDVLVRPAVPWRSARMAAAWLVVLPLVVFGQVWMADRFEWPLVVRLLCVGAGWIAAGAAMVGSLRGRRQPTARAALACSMVLLALYPAAARIEKAVGGADRGRHLQRFDRYAALDPSFAVLDDVASGRPLVSTAFMRFERAHSNIAAA